MKINNYSFHNIKTDEILICDIQASSCENLTSRFLSKLNFYSKHILNFVLITIMLIGICLSSMKKAEAGMILGDHRYTTGAIAADMAQCAALIAIWYVTRVVMTTFFRNLIIWCWANSIPPNPSAPYWASAAVWLENNHWWLVEIAAAAALYAAWLALEEWAESTRQSVHILNNFDEGNPYYCEKFDHRNDVYKYGPINKTYGDCNKTIYTKNENYNKIAIYYDSGNKLPTGASGPEIIKALNTGSPPDDQYVWIDPYDCKELDVLGANFAGLSFDLTRWICAYEEDGQICADVVFCTSLEIIQFIKYILPGMFFFNKVSGYIADPVFDSDQGTRTCNKNPWTGQNQDDYNNGDGRCECACCPGNANQPSMCSNTVQDSSGNTVSQDFACTTYNERYRAHCIPRGKEDIDIDPPVVAPTAVSAYCDANVSVGYTPFPLAGKLMRCFDKTINNVFYGTREIVSYDEDGQIKIEDGAIVLEKQCVEGRVNSAGMCDSSLLMKFMDAYKDIIRLMLVLFVTFIGVKMMMGANYAFPDLFKMIMKISLVTYFAMGDAWKDGYYTTLLSMGAELGAEYYALSDTAASQIQGSMQTSLAESGEINSFECTVTAVGSSEALVGSIEECNFTTDDGYDGVVYAPEDEHFIVWDILDCKFATYTGFSVTKTFPYLVSFAWAMILSVSTGFLTLIAAFVILYASLTVMLTALYIGILTLFNITLLIYIAPIIIPLVLFEQTKSIFSKWLSMLLGYSIQPMILFAVLSFLFAIIDQLFLTTMPQVFSSEVTKTDILLGITGYKVQSAYDFTTLVVSVLKFTIAMVILSSLFKRITEIISSLSGASVSGMPKIDEIKKAITKTAGKATKFAGNAAKYSYRYGMHQRNKGLETREKNREKIQEGLEAKYKKDNESSGASQGGGQS